jgi:hypothetical protein
MGFEALELTGATAGECRAVILRLAHLILEAAGVEIGEVSDDER